MRENVNPVSLGWLGINTVLATEEKAMIAKLFLVITIN